MTMENNEQTLKLGKLLLREPTLKQLNFKSDNDSARQFHATESVVSVGQTTFCLVNKKPRHELARHLFDDIMDIAVTTRTPTKISTYNLH